MSNQTTWVVLGDGRYSRIFEHKGPGKDLVTLRSNDLEALAKLTYEIITRKLPAVLSEQVQELIVGEHNAELLARPIHEIEVLLGDLTMKSHLPH